VPAQQPEQRLLVERLLHERHRPHAGVPERLLGVPSHGDDHDARPLEPDGIGQFGALHRRHHDVGEQQVDRAPVVAAERESGLPVSGDDGVVAVALQHLLGLFAQLRLVVHDEHRPPAVVRQLPPNGVTPKLPRQLNDAPVAPSSA
jgi:hypothetical protein